ncbi:BadF/BadG/BcrA/BcrD ATPase family protein [Pseudogemmobacter blasticus]|uniref:ATPase n=1 Tax=Fuscovulum blasticum DSM 2131 TaxID=1188250 RepID=A0A2T4JFC0_FUSBL|nr:BadF/BadG/BcrA/BcrD ATPase family protein [Fuscovulum blasticum]PTE16614.1 ATPase [Fuscovulum blasticum DSM 2131]
MHYLVGVDGGGTGCRVAVADSSGAVLARAEGGPANIASDTDAAARTILACVSEALTRAAGLLADLRTVRAGLGLAGANARGAPERLAAALPFAARIETDAIAATRGALGGADGLLAAMGTGSVFVRQRGGETRQFGGWGLILGDEGSGARLGRAALSRALRAHDGFTPLTPFLCDLLARHGGPSGVVAFSLTATPRDFGALAPEILASDDPAARALWAENVSDIAEILQALGAGPGLPVTFTGGLGPAYAAALPHLPQRTALGTALDGALLLAREVG